MNFSDFKTGLNDEGRRIDKVIRIFIPDSTLSEIYKYLRKGLIKVNQKKIKPDYKICHDDIISIASFILEKSPDIKSSLSKKLPELPNVVFQNTHILLLNKPYDTTVHGFNDSLDKIVSEYYKNSVNDNSLSFRPGPLHRLDKKTTGLIAFSMSLEGAKWFSENISEHVIHKSYLGIVQGAIETQQEWIDEIKKENNSSENFHTVTINEGFSDDNGYKKSITYVIPVQCGKYNGNDVSLVMFNIKTGRTHQIRAQSSLHHHPLLGDTAYGGIKISGFKQDFFLHAALLEFPKSNPIGLPEQIKLSPPDEFLSILKYCGINKTGL